MNNQNNNQSPDTKKGNPSWDQHNKGNGEKNEKQKNINSDCGCGCGCDEE